MTIKMTKQGKYYNVQINVELLFEDYDVAKDFMADIKNRSSKINNETKDDLEDGE